MGLSNASKAWLEQVGSTIIHKNLLVRQIAARHILKLEAPSDVLLRWRTGMVLNDNPNLWARTVGEQQHAGLNPSRWPNAVLGVDHEKWQSLLSQDCIPAVAYRLGSLTMIGVRELDASVDFAVRVNERGQHDPNGSFHGVVMRTGSGFEGAIGTAAKGSDCFFPLKTHMLARLGEVPEGLKRV